MKEGRINIIDKVNGAAREGALGHATQIEAAQSGAGNGKDGKPTKDPDAGWRVKNDSRGNKKSTYGFSAMAANIRNGAKFLTLYGIPGPSYAG